MENEKKRKSASLNDDAEISTYQRLTKLEDRNSDLEYSLWDTKVLQDILNEILKVDDEIKKVTSDIQNIEYEINTAESNILNLSGEDKAHWMRKEEVLRTEKNALRTEKNELRAKENVLRAKENVLIAKMKPVSEAEIQPIYSKVAEKTLSGLKLAEMTSDSFLEFPFKINEFRDFDQVLQSVYVRSCYIDILNLICESITSGIKRIVVTGTPGIGKSTFVYYFIWKFLKNVSTLNQDQFNLYIQCAPDKILQFKSDRVLQLKGIEASLRLQDDEKALVLVDMVKTEEPTSCSGIRIVLSSPNPARFKEFIKKPHEIFYMNPWLYDEILVVWKKSYKNMLSIGEVDRAYNICGGIIRYVLQQNNIAETVMNTAFGALSDGVMSLSRFVGSKSAEDEKVTYKILHYISPDYRDKEAKLALGSALIAERLFKYLKESEKDDAITFMDSNQLSYFKSAAGVIFERLAHKSICESGLKSLRRINLTSKFNEATKDIWDSCVPFRVSDVFEIDSLSFSPSFPIYFSNFSTINNISRGEYFQPFVGNFQSIDSFSIIGTNVFAFQCTTAKAHPVLGDGLIKLVDFVEKSFPNELFNYHLVFILPATNDAKKFKVQPITMCVDSDCIPDKVKPFVVNQWIAELEIISSIAKKFSRDPVAK